MTDTWIDRLSEYLDGDLTDAEQVQLEDHLRVCDDCIATLQDLRAVVARAQGLEDRPPVAQLWSGIAERIGSERRPVGRTRVATGRSISFSIPQLLAAGIALMTISAGAAWLALRGSSPVEGSAIGAGPVQMTAQPVIDTDQYDAAIAELDHILAGHQDQLEPSTVQALEQSIAAIDEAIAEARAALAADPANLYLNSHLADTMRRKIHLLSRAAALTRATT